jgi:hypothetical protein
MNGEEDQKPGDEMEPTAPPEKKEPEPEKGEEGGEEDEGEGDEMDEAYKSLMAELKELRGDDRPASDPDPVQSPAPEVDMAGDDEIVVDADTLLKAIQQNIDEGIGGVAAEVEAQKEQMAKSANVQTETLKLLKAVSEQNTKLANRVMELEERSAGRRGFRNIWEAGADGMAKSMSAEEYGKAGSDYLAKAFKACSDGKLSPEQVSMVEIVVNRGLSVKDILTPQERAIIESN